MAGGRPAARVTDPTVHQEAPLAPGPGSPNVIIAGLPAWRAEVDTHLCPAGGDGIGVVRIGSPTVRINGQMACRQGDIVVETPGVTLGPMNPIAMGCPTVWIGDSVQAATMRAAKRAAAGLTAVNCNRP